MILPQDKGPSSHGCECLHGHTMPNAVGHIDTISGNDVLAQTAHANAITKADQGHTGMHGITRHNRQCKMRLAIQNKFSTERGHQVIENYGSAQAAPATGVNLAVETGIVPEDRVDTDVVTMTVFVHGEAGRAIAAIPTKIDGVEHAMLADLLAGLKAMKTQLAEELARQLFLNNLICAIGCMAVIYRTCPSPSKLKAALKIEGHPFLGFDPVSFYANWVDLAVPTWIDVLTGAGIEISEELKNWGKPVEPAPPVQQA